MIVDVGHVIEVYADFSGQGQGYTQFPDGNRYRIRLDDLRDEKTRDRLRLIWTDPHTLDPAKTAARVTREVSDRLAALGLSFEGKGHAPEAVARFLMRCLFTMFAEDVELIPKASFSDLLKRLRGQPEHSAPMLKSLWETMNTGGFSTVLTAQIKHFNGGLFKDADALPLDTVQLSLLIEAASRDWREVEPAIFGTLLERALSPKERHKLGAHYTPRAYVDRLVAPALMEPLRADWAITQATTLQLNRDGKLDEARAAVRAFHRQLCEIRVLDPACGSGNFLYVALELMKRLEGEVTALLAELGEDQAALSLAGHTVDPHQFLGIELNPWAAAVAELVLWIGYLQWHFRTHGRASPAEPVLRDFKNIENRDAVLTWASRKPRVDDAGKTVTRWDGETMIRHPVTGEDVPDPDARIQVYDYLSPKPATWPEADFIIGNPPFIGASRIRDALGDGYAEALWAAYPRMPQSADFVMFWWDKAALMARTFKSATDKAPAKGTRRFGFITTNSITMVFNRRVLETHIGAEAQPLQVTFAVPDHPWVDSADGAAVRIAMTVGEAGQGSGRLFECVTETRIEDGNEGRDVEFSISKGHIHSNLRLGANLGSANALLSNSGLAHMGMKLHGSGFAISREKAKSLGLGTVPDLANHIRPYRNGRDIAATPRGVFVVDLYGLQEEEARSRFGLVFQHLLDTVKPERDQNNRETYRVNWWIFAEPRTVMRQALLGLNDYIVTTETSKHRLFSLLPAHIIPDQKLRVIASDDRALLSALSSRFHGAWALATGGLLGPTPVYNNTRCFDPFPFPTPTEAQTTRLRALGEELDAHRKAQAAAHPKLTLTGMYNVLEKLRAGERIEGKDREIYDQGLIGILRDIHARIDAEVAAAYGWPADLPDAEILQRLVDLNHERAAEEARGLVRWLRPDYQNPAGRAVAATGQTASMDLGPAEPSGIVPWPKTLPEQFAALRGMLADMEQATPQQIARRFQRLRPATVQPLLETLHLLGHARMVEGGRFTA